MNKTTTPADAEAWADAQVRRHTARSASLAGHTFGRLQVVAGPFYVSKNRSASWDCRCECGSMKRVLGSSLKCGETRSCGCLKREIAKKAGERTRTHGMTRTPEHRTWSGMLQRCRDKNCKDYARYGAKGISVCERWADSFSAFLEDMGQKPSPEHSIDRIDPFGNYEPGNCRWATASEQQRNKRGFKRAVIDGVSRSVAEWTRVLGMSEQTVRGRIQRGWDAVRALTTPVNKAFNWRANK